MASLKAEKPVAVGAASGQAKKEAAKPGGSAPKAPSSNSKPAPKRSEQKPREPKKKVLVGNVVEVTVTLAAVKQRNKQLKLGGQDKS